MNFKRRRHPAARAGCSMCKPHKKGGANPDTGIHHHGFGKIRDLRSEDEPRTIPTPKKGPRNFGVRIYFGDSRWRGPYEDRWYRTERASLNALHRAKRGGGWNFAGVVGVQLIDRC